MVRTKNLASVDVVVADGTTPLVSLIGRASVAGVPLVVWSDAPESDLGPSSFPVIVGANVGSALAEALVTHPSLQPDDSDFVQVAWTESGEPLTRGTAIPFPEPVGMAWAEERSAGRFVAYRNDDWGAASAIVEDSAGRRIVGVADLVPHLEAITLVAVAFAAANASFDAGIQRASNAAEAVLTEVRNLELDLAVWRPLVTRHP